MDLKGEVSGGQDRQEFPELANHVWTLADLTAHEKNAQDEEKCRSARAMKTSFEEDSLDLHPTEELLFQSKKKRKLSPDVSVHRPPSPLRHTSALPIPASAVGLEAQVARDVGEGEDAYLYVEMLRMLSLWESMCQQDSSSSLASSRRIETDLAARIAMEPAGAKCVESWSKNCRKECKHVIIGIQPCLSGIVVIMH